MASIYLKKNTRFYYAQWSVFDLKTLRWKIKNKSTKEENPILAQQMADEWQRNADAVAALSGARRRGAAPQGRVPKMSEREREILAAALERDPSRDPRRKAGLWKDFKESYLARVENPTTRAEYASCLARWEKFCEATGVKLEFLEDVDIDLAESWIAELIKSGISRGRVNFYRGLLNTIYERARKRGLVVVNPFAAIQPLKLKPTEDNLPARPLTDDELMRLCLAPYKLAASEARSKGWCAGMAEEWEVLIQLTAVTGQRLLDAVDMKWGMLDLENGILDYLPAKTKRSARRIAFPLKFWPKTVAMMIAWREDSTDTSPDDLVFPLINKASYQRAKRSHWPSYAFIKIVEAAGIERKDLRGGEGRGRRRVDVGFHSLRHTANTKAAAMGIPAEIRKELFGHSTVEMNRIYTHWNPEVLEEIISRAQKG